MKLIELADLLGIKIEIYYTTGAVGPWIAHFKCAGSVGFKTNIDSGLIGSCFGSGPTPNAALSSLAYRLNEGPEKIIVIEKTGRDRFVAKIPEELTA
jgi:hypothetical protein